MVTITYIRAVKSNGQVGGDALKWCYLGKDANKRQQVACVLGEDRRMPLKDRLYKISSLHRQSYLDFISRLGRDEKGRLEWWAGKFSSKSPFHTDFFLLYCYHRIARELISKDDGKGWRSLIIVIEDPWLFDGLRQDVALSSATWKGRPRLLSRKLFYATRGCIRRLILPVWFMAAQIIMYFYHGGKRPDVAKSRCDNVALINPAEKRAFGKDSCYEAHYMPGLREFFTDNGRNSFYIYLFPFPFSTAKDVGNNKDVLWPLIFDAGWINVLRRTLQVWRPLCRHCMLDGVDVSLLLEREVWTTFSSLGFNFHLILYDAFCHFMKNARSAAFIYLFENQAWEKMLCAAASDNGCRAIGYQHSSICTYYISQFIGQDEREHIPLPYKLVTAGRYSAHLYAVGGIPEDKIAIGGAWRYQHMLDVQKEGPVGSGKGFLRPRVLVSLPLDIFLVRSLLTQLLNAMSSTGISDAVDMVIKPHPGTSDEHLAEIRKLASGNRLVFEPFIDLVQASDTVIVSTSTSGLEAFLLGKNVINYMPENFIAPDPLLDIEDARIHKWFEGDEFDTDLFLRPYVTDPPGESKDHIASYYFSKVNPELWLEVVSHKGKL